MILLVTGGITFDWTVSVGNVLTIISAAGILIGLYFSIRSDIRILRHDFKNMDHKQNILGEAFTQLTSILKTVAVQDERINQHTKDIDELKHGKGYVN